MSLIQNETTSQYSTRSVSTPLLLWLSCSLGGSVLFTVTYLIEGATRPDYNPWQQAISALSLGPGGWVQQINFIVFGIIFLWTAFAWRTFLRGGVGATWFPILRVIEGCALIIDGFFSQDPAPGYPKGAILTAPTLPGTIHVICAFVAIIAQATSFFVLARRFSKEPQWRGWAAFSILIGLLTIILIAAFGAANGQHSEFAGLLERLSTGVATLWSILFFARLWSGKGLKEC